MIFIKLFFALIFTNLLGIIYDVLEGRLNRLKLKSYLMPHNLSLPVILWVVFTRNISHIFTFLEILDLKRIINSISIFFFVFVIYHLIDYKHTSFRYDFFVLFISCFIFWSFAYSYISMTSFYFHSQYPFKMSKLGGDVIIGSANILENILFFLRTLVFSVITFPVYILSFITFLYTYFIGQLLQ